MNLRTTAAAGAILASLPFLAGTVLVKRLAVPRRFPFNVTPATVGLRFEEVEFHARHDAKRLAGWFMPATAGTGPVRHAVIVVQGWNRHRADEELKTIEIYAGLTARGLDVFAIDLRGRGTSSHAANRFGDTEYRDVLGAYDSLRERFAAEGTPFRVGVLGFSMGAAVAILAAANEPGISPIVADSPFADVREIVRRDLRRITRLPGRTADVILGIADRLGLSIGSYRPIDVVERIAPRPILLIHGEQDYFIPLEHSERLARLAGEGARTWYLPGSGHVGGYYNYGEAYLDRVAAALRGEAG